MVNSADSVDIRKVIRGGRERQGAVSVIVPSCDSETFLESCLASVAKQDYSRFECIVVDDCSTDGSSRIARRWADKDRRFRLVAHRARGGPAAMRNTGLLNALGEYVTFLDPGEIIYGDTLSIRMDAGLSELAAYDSGETGACPPTTSETVVKRSVLIDAGGFAESREQSSEERRVYDVLVFPHKDYHVWTTRSILRELERAGLSCACVDLTYAYGDEGARAALKRFKIESITLNEYLMIGYRPKVVLCFNDWDERVIRPIIERCNDDGIPTIGIVEGVQDFDDSDTPRSRQPYRVVRYVLLAGPYDQKFFRGSEQDLRVIGVPRIEELLMEPVRTPESPLVVINQNFTYGVLTGHAKEWLDSVVRACVLAEVPYVVSQHPADETDLDGYEASDLDMYELIRRGSVFVSRFSSGILESLALGKPVVYHNPHGERVDKFQDGMDVYRMTETVEELAEELNRLATWSGSVRDDAHEFLNVHCNIDEETPAAVSAAEYVCGIVGR